MNSVALIGRLTADPQTHAGEKHESATFRLAVPKTGTDGADFIDIVTFDKLASVCGEWLTKGREVAVVGKLRLSEWTGRDGERRSKVQVSTPTKPEVSPGTRGGRRRPRPAVRRIPARQPDQNLGISTLGIWKRRCSETRNKMARFLGIQPRRCGRILGIEVKANQRVSATDLRGLRKLREALGARFMAGIAFSTGSRSYTAEDRLHVLPIDRLWRPMTR